MQGNTITSGKGTSFRFYVAVLVDVLGQHEILQKWSTVPQNEEDELRVADAIEASFGRVVTVRDDFRSFLINYSRGHNLPDEYARQLPDEGRELRRFQHMSTECLQFSDTIAAFCPIVNAHGYVTLEPVLAFLLCSGWLLLLSLSKSTPIRGGIEVGIAGRFPDADLYGPLLAAIDRLEKRKAVYPRIVVGKTLLRFIADMAADSTESGPARTNRLLGDLCGKLICQDDDGEWIIDYLGALGARAHGNQHIWREVASHAMRFTKSEYDRFSSAGNSQMKDRYVRILRYFEARGLTLPTLWVGD